MAPSFSKLRKAQSPTRIPVKGAPPDWNKARAAMMIRPERPNGASVREIMKDAKMAEDAVYAMLRWYKDSGLLIRGKREEEMISGGTYKTNVYSIKEK
jgi:hypothetical protein